MDDEAIIKVTRWVVVGLLLGTAVIIFGLGWARSPVPKTTAMVPVMSIRAAQKACDTLVGTTRVNCELAVAETPVLLAAMNDCNYLASPPWLTRCVQDVMKEVPK